MSHAAVHRLPVRLVVALLTWASFALSLPCAAAEATRRLDPGTAAAAGFDPVAPAAAGILFTNHLPTDALLQNQNLLNGAGVAAGDVNGDGRPDLYFCAIRGTNALYLNRGQWQFEEATAPYGVGCANAQSSGAVFADTDGDGDLDLLVTSLGRGLRLFRNEEGRRFTEITAEAGVASTTGSTSLAVGDVDGDGDLDVYVANYGALSVLRSGGRAEMKRVNGEWVITGPHAHRLRWVDGRVEEVGEADVLFLNEGQNRFRAVPWGTDTFQAEDGSPKPAPLDYGLAVQMRDLTGDGAPEIYVCNDYQTPDRLWINDGRGRFREASFRALRKFAFSSMGVDFADLDRDGNPDFFVTEMASREHARHARQLSGVVPLPNLPGRVDGRPQVLRNLLYRGNGDGTWSDIAEFSGTAATDWSWQPTFLDVDLDGYEDLLVGNGMLFDMLDRDAPARIQAFGKQSPESARTNLLLYPSFLSPNVALRNQGNLTFADHSAAWGFQSTRISQGMALADLDGDGDQDVVLNTLQDAPLLYRNRSAAPRLAVRLRGLAPNTQGIGARLKVTGGPVEQTQEIISGGRYLSGDDPVRTFACGPATNLVLEVTWRSGARSTLPHALPNHEYLIDESEAAPAAPATRTRTASWFVDASNRLNHSHTEPLFDDFVRQPLLARHHSAQGPAVAWIDLDGDGHTECLIGTGRGGRLGAYRFEPGGAPRRIPSEWTAPDDVLAFTASVAASGRRALIATVSGYEFPGTPQGGCLLITWPGGDATLQVEPLPGLPTHADATLPGVVATADFDGDGDLDLFQGGNVRPGQYPQASASRLLRREGDVYLEDPTAQPLLTNAGLVSAAVWADLESDGFPELILAREWAAPLVLRRQAGTWSIWDLNVAGWPGSDAREPLSQRTGWWTSVAAADWDGDGRLDLALGNWGWNSGYAAAPARPLRLYHGALGPGGTRDLIESYVDATTGREVPVRSLNALGRAMPQLMGRFANHRIFAESSLADLLGALPPKPDQVEANTLTSVVLLNRAEGWQVSALPNEAQWSPAFGLVPADVDADGFLDLFVAQNFFAMRVEWPRNDAGRGLWLRGDGRGRFTSVPGTTSGIVMLGEQRGAALGDPDRDGVPDLLVAQNGTSTGFWKSRRKPGATTRRIDLVGPPGNPMALGASLRAEAAGTWGPRLEISSASGYRSVHETAFWLTGPQPVTRLQILWPGGRLQEYSLPTSGQRFRLAADGTIATREQ